MSSRPFGTLQHSTLERPRGSVESLATATLNDREKVAVLLQLAAALALLVSGGKAGLRLAWFGVDGGGMLRLKPSLRSEDLPRAPEGHCQDLMMRAIDTLFGSVGALVQGRGSARRVVRALQQRWGQTLVDISADRAVADLLGAAPFLWEARYGSARRALVACHSAVVASDAGLPQPQAREALWAAGPGRFRRALLRDVEGYEDAAALVASTRCRRIWACEPASGGRFRVGAVGQGEGGRDGLELAERACLEGRYLQALSLVRSSEVKAPVLRLLCELELGRLHAARLQLAALERSLDPLSEEFWPVARAALRVFANLGQKRRLREWMARVLWVGRQRPRAPSHLLAAQGYWDLGLIDRAELHLARSRARERAGGCWTPASGTVLDLAEWNQTRALVHLTGGQPEKAIRRLHEAIHACRRSVPPVRAGRLWSDLVSARALSDDLAGAERAARHAFRLLSGCEGPLSQTLALHNLAEVRVRRGLLRGVEEVLCRAEALNDLAKNRRARSYDAELRARWLLSLGRLEPAFELLRATQGALEESGDEWNQDAMKVLLARVEGWRGRTARAAVWLEGVSPEGVLEWEEVPALWLLAGEEIKARESARGPARVLWRRALEGLPLRQVDWDRIEPLEPYRRARLVWDLRCIGVGVGERWLAWAERQFRFSSAEGLADALAMSGGGALGLLAHLAGSRPSAKDWQDLFARVREPEAELRFRRKDGIDGDVVFAGRCRENLTEVASRSGRWQLTMAGRNPDAEALLEVLARGVPPLEEPASTAAAATEGGIIGRSKALQEALRKVRHLSKAGLSLLILGETGTGKELVARLSHRASKRSGSSFVPVNCAALSESLALSELFGHARGAFTGAERERKGVFEESSGGTVFLDEIGDLHGRAQGMLLRVLQEGEVCRLGESRARPVDVRVVAATHRNLQEMIDTGSFRRDLLFRLRVGVVELPPLRDRGNDVLLLVESFLSPLRASDSAARILRQHSWPGNVRELKAVLDAAAALATGAGRTVVEIDDLDLQAPEDEPALSYHDWLNQLRRARIGEALAAAGGNQSAAARSLGLTRQAMSYLIRELGVRPPDRGGHGSGETEPQRSRKGGSRDLAR